MNMKEIQSLFINEYGASHPEYLNLHQQRCDDHKVRHNHISLCTFMIAHSATSFRLAKDTLRKEAVAKDTLRKEVVCNLAQ
jgi:hypothetical protein